MDRLKKLVKRKNALTRQLKDSDDGKSIYFHDNFTQSGLKKI